ncbi:MAG: hypothetical protein K6E52_06225 [Bacteroidaceae bacterium]|nr:hypothetical protein [Bacteroidaceae bacterium]
MQNHKYIYSGDEIHTFEPYKRKKYYVIAVKQSNPNLKNSHILHTRYPLPISQNEDRIFVKKPGLHTQPPSPNVELLKYYENLRPHQIFDERINSKISNYNIYGNCLAVIHIYQNKAGFYRTRLSLVTENRGKLHFETINDFSTEHAAEHAMLNMLLSHDT